jgi:predicted ATPase
MAKKESGETQSIPELVRKLEGMKRGSSFTTFIDSLRLYSFKNIRDGTPIDFAFPITALVGPNGCGKSSVLQALYGCPEGKSLGAYWFSTTLDPISDDDGSRPALVYTYKGIGGAEHEVVKTRIRWNKKEGASQNFDYWEPSRPIKRLGMTPLPEKARHPTISMNVVVIDFRYQLSAFDRYFYLEDVDYYNQSKRRSKQDVLRLRSVKILAALDPSNQKSKTHDAVHILEESECRTLSIILGKRYRGGKILHHKVHGFWAYTVVFQVESSISPHQYTEANAGSGEVAVALLVHKLSRVKQGSLVLLDEPEYALHPGAQREVMTYLLRQCVEKQLQVVYTTHSPAMIDGLPRRALKVFDIDPATERFVVHQDRSTDEAFVSLGQRVHFKRIIRVEDSLAKQLLNECMKRLVERKELPPEFPDLVEVVFAPGGVGAMKQDLVSYSRDKTDVYMVFDGTETPTKRIELGKVPVEHNTAEGLAALLKEVTNEEIRFPRDGGASGGRSDQHVNAIRDYISYWNSRVFFLPFNAPEEAIWCSENADHQLQLVFPETDCRTRILDELSALSAKARFARLAVLLYDGRLSSDILRLQTLFLKAWLHTAADDVAKVGKVVLCIREHINNAGSSK